MPQNSVVTVRFTGSPTDRDDFIHALTADGGIELTPPSPAYRGAIGDGVVVGLLVETSILVAKGSYALIRSRIEQYKQRSKRSIERRDPPKIEVTVDQDLSQPQQT